MNKEEYELRKLLGEFGITTEDESDLVNKLTEWSETTVRDALRRQQEEAVDIAQEQCFWLPPKPFASPSSAIT